MDRKPTAVGVAAVLLVAVVYLLSGGGVPDTTDQPGPGDTSGETTEKTDEQRIEQFQPNDPDTEESVETPSFYPAGINGSGGVATQTVIDNHQSILEQNSVTVQLSEQTEATPRNTTYRKSDDQTTKRSEQRDTVQTAYSDGELVYENTENGYTVRNGTISVGELSNNGFFESVFAMTQPDSITEETVDGDKIILLQRTRDDGTIAGNAQSIGYTAINSITATFRIRETGLIASADVTIAGSQFGSPHSETVQYDIRGLSQTSVTEPSWTDEARQSKTIVETDFTSNGWIVVEHRGLATLSKDARLTITNQSGGDHTITLPQTFSEGDTLYVYKTSNGWVPQVNTQPPRSSVRTGSVFIVSGTDSRDLFRTPAS